MIPRFPLPSLDLPAIAELAALGARFVHWRLERGENGKPTKVPYRPYAKANLRAASDKPATWDTFQVACDALANTDRDGIGFVPRTTEDGILAIDLDGCIDPTSGEIADWAERLVESLNSYTELSPSGTGLKVFARANPVPTFIKKERKVDDAPILSDKEPQIEILGLGRYTTLTGKLFGDAPLEIRDAGDVLIELAEWMARPPDDNGAGHANGQASPCPPGYLAAAAEVIQNPDLIWHDWNDVGMRFWVASGGAEAGCAAFDTFSAKSRKYDAGATRERWQGLRRSPPTRYTATALVNKAREYDPAFPDPLQWTPPDSDYPNPAQPFLDGINGQASGSKAIAWPDPLGEAAYYGLAGEVVRAIEPHTESAPEALLVSFLVCFGNSLGRGPHVRVEGSKHATNEFAVFIGESSKARKGTGWNRTLQVFEAAEAAATFEGINLNADGSWVADCVTHGLSSGEGLIHQVRDKQFKREPIRGKGKVITGYQDVEVDEGVADKRLMVVEEEFAATLRMMARDGNSLSSIIRQAWDSGNLRTLTKNSPSRTTGALISLVGHCTVDELRRYLDRTELGNGFANRLMFVCVKRSKCLPFGGSDADLESLGARVNVAQRQASAIDQVCWTDSAREMWAEVYPSLSER